MKWQRKQIWLFLLSATFLFCLTAILWIIMNSQDSPLPDMSEFERQTKDVSDEDNAYYYFRKASECYVGLQDNHMLIKIAARTIYDANVVHEHLKNNKETLDFIDRGLSCSAYQGLWSSYDDDVHPHLAWGNVGHTLSLKAISEVHEKHIDLAFETCLDLLRFGLNVSEYPSYRGDCIIGVYIIKQAYHQIEYILRHFEISPSLLVRLQSQLESGALSRGLEAMLKTEFLRNTQAVDFMGPEKRYTFHPNRIKTMLANHYRCYIENIPRYYAELDLPSEGQYKNELKDAKSWILWLSPNQEGKVLLAIAGLDYHSIVQCRYEAECYLIALQLMIAHRQFVNRYDSFPPALQSLVPEFLSEIPVDPYDGKPFRYLPKHGIAYSVGRDLKDTTESDPPLEYVPVEDKGDWVYFVSKPEK